MIPKNKLIINTSLPLIFIFFISVNSWADRLHVAVASNFVPTIEQLAAAFKNTSGHDLLISTGSTGQLYAQIKQGAPYDILMAADTLRPKLLTKNESASGYFVYAIGQLVLLSNRNEKQSCQAVLDTKGLQHLAIANPELAPYGLAAKQYLQHSATWQSVQSKLVMGENINQTMQMVATGNATAGLVAQSVLVNHELQEHQCIWPVPAESHQMIEQAMVLLNKPHKLDLYKQFRAFLSSHEAIQIIHSNGYLFKPDDSKK